MGYIEIADGVMNHRQHVHGLEGTVRIDLSTAGSSTVVVPEGISVRRTPNNVVGRDRIEGHPKGNFGEATPE